MEAANIKGNDVETYVKATQLMGSFAQGYYKYDFDLKNKNHAILTVHYCPAFNALEKQDLEHLDWVCKVLEHEGMKAYVKPVNPDIQGEVPESGPSPKPGRTPLQVGVQAREVDPHPAEPVASRRYLAYSPTQKRHDVWELPDMPDGF